MRSRCRRLCGRQGPWWGLVLWTARVGSRWVGELGGRVLPWIGAAGVFYDAGSGVEYAADDLPVPIEAALL